MSQELVEDACWREEGVEVPGQRAQAPGSPEGLGMGLCTPGASLSVWAPVAHPEPRKEGSLPAQLPVSDTVVTSEEGAFD